MTNPRTNTINSKLFFKLFCGFEVTTSVSRFLIYLQMDCLQIVLYEGITLTVVLRKTCIKGDREKNADKNIWTYRGEELTGSCETLHNEQLHNLYSLVDITRMLK
jgi:hypothetical protein